jgi:hypothetical protein
MKKLLFMLIVILLTPVYFIIKISEKMMEFITVLTSPCAEGMCILIQNMTDFWKNILKKIERRDTNEFSEKN